MDSDDPKESPPEQSTPKTNAKVRMLVCVIIQSNPVVLQLNFVRQHSAAGDRKAGEASGPGGKVWEVSSPVVKVGGGPRSIRGRPRNTRRTSICKFYFCAFSNTQRKRAPSRFIPCVNGAEPVGVFCRGVHIR